MSLALFDLDETLLPVDSDYLWSTFMVEKGYIVGREFMEQKDIFKQEYIEGRLDIYAYVSFMANYINRLGADRDRYQGEFISEIIKPNVTPSARSLVQDHRDRGDVTIIITSTSDFIVSDIARLFEVDHLISTELESEIREGALYYTGRPKGPPSFREGKVQRIENFLLAHPEHSWEGSYFYSDSLNDLPLLERVEYPQAVNPDPTLLRQAQLRGWNIIDLHGKKNNS